MSQENISKNFLELVAIMDRLRAECPWDKKQTIQSLRSNTIEELYELVDAIIEEDWQGIKEELGDLLLHILFYTKIASEKNEFILEEVIEGISKKLIHRHPHIYGNVKADTEEQVKLNWEQLKLKEGDGTKTLLSGVPNSLPSMVKALRIQEKVKQVGFEWENKEQVWEKVHEEIGELQHEVAQNNKEKMEDELGDVFFSLINYARFLNIDPETALEKTNKKFKHRFELMETYAKENGLDLAKLSLEEKNSIIDTSIIKNVIEHRGIKKLFINGKTAFNVFYTTLNIEEKDIKKSSFDYTTVNGNNRNFSIYETEIFGCKIIAWNIYIHQGCPQDLIKKIESYLQ